MPQFVISHDTVNSQPSPSSLEADGVGESAPQAFAPSPWQKPQNRDKNIMGYSLAQANQFKRNPTYMIYF